LIEKRTAARLSNCPLHKMNVKGVKEGTINEWKQSIEGDNNEQEGRPKRDA